MPVGVVLPPSLLMPLVYCIEYVSLCVLAGTNCMSAVAGVEACLVLDTSLMTKAFSPSFECSR